jgi:16S rRNA (cytidine1402-2'-O)-methyltransferase
MSDISENPQGRLSIVATPIGNMGDMTFRGLWTLKECDVIYAEDTRVISKLLAHYGLKKPLQRLDAATEAKKAGEVAERLGAGEWVAYVSDAGTPGISDPGARLVAHVRAHVPEATIEALPGPSSVTAALSISGISSDSFVFLGFLPHKKGRQSALKDIMKSTIPVVLFESPHRILKLLKEIAALAPQCRVTVAKELTKMHEGVFLGTPLEVSNQLEKGKAAKGEYVVIVHSE